MVGTPTGGTPTNPFSLTDWHRRRRQGLSPRHSDSFASPLLASPETEALVDAQSSPPSDAFPDDSPAFHSAHLFPASPVTCASPAECTRDDLVRRNTRFVRWEYEFGRILGEGSFGQVHEAKHRRTGLRRAIKEIPKSGTETEEFEWELQALVALDHPHIVSVIEWFDDEDNYYLVMEMCTGPDLFRYILNAVDGVDGSSPGMVPESDVSVILRQCLKAVLCCHANGFIHRDLNAKNFMLTGIDRTVKLIDFGLAKRFLGFMPTDRFIEVVGTSHYMSPEMLLDGEYSPAADLWSMGVLLYVMLTGTMLLPKDDEKKRSLLKKKGYIKRRLDNCKILQQRETSAQAREMLEKMLQHDAPKRITASDALLHPFILNSCHDFLGPPLDEFMEFDKNIVLKLRSFAKAPRLKKVALLIITHLSDHEKGLLSVRHMFRTLDTDGDGEISLADLTLGLSVHEIEAPADLEEMFAACDSDSSSRLSYQEFVAALLPADFIDERLCHEAFNLLDIDCKGVLTAEDLQSTCRSYPLEKCQKMVSQADTTGKGYFDFEDFHRFMRGEDVAIEEPPRKLARHESSGPVSPNPLAGISALCSPPPMSSPPICSSSPQGSPELDSAFDGLVDSGLGVV